jgi:hypothetical protein
MYLSATEKEQLKQRHDKLANSVDASGEHEIDELLKKAHDVMIQKRVEKIYHQFDKRWQRLYEPMFRDYLMGMLVSEVSTKHHYHRTEFYSLLKYAEIPLQPFQAEKYLNMVKRNKAHTIELTENVLTCQCDVCKWLKRRAKRIATGEIK